MMRQNGFSLIEVMIAIVIVGIITAAFVPLFSTGFKEIMESGIMSSATYTQQEEFEDEITAASDYTSITINDMIFHNAGGDSRTLTIGTVSKYGQGPLMYLTYTQSTPVVSVANSGYDEQSTPADPRRNLQFSFKVWVNDTNNLPMTGLSQSNFEFDVLNGSVSYLSVTSIIEDSENPGTYTVTAKYSRKATIEITITVDGTLLSADGSVSSPGVEVNVS